MNDETPTVAAPEPVQAPPPVQSPETPTEPTDGSAAPNGEAGEPAKRHKPNKLERQFARQGRLLDEFSRQISDLNNQVLTLKQGGRPDNGTTAPADEGPKEAQFKDYGQYLEARAEWKAQKVAERIQSDMEQRRQADTVKSQRDANIQAHSQRVEAAYEKYPDFDEVAFSDDVPVTQAMVTMLVESDKGPDLQYYLGKHPEEATRIAKLSEVRNPQDVQEVIRAHAIAARELGKIEARLEAPPAKPATAAPEPPATVKGVVRQTIKPSDPASDKQDIKTWVAQRNREVAERRKNGG